MTHSILTVRRLTNQLERHWVDYVASHPDAGFFHGSPWRVAVQSAFGHVPHYLLAFRGQDVAAVLPMFQVDSIVAGRLLVSLPYATYGGVLADDESAAAALLEEARACARRIGARSLELRSIRAADATLPVVETHATFRRPLPEHVEELAHYLPRKARAAARKASERNDLEAAFGDHLLPVVWQLYARSMRRLGSPNYPLRFFKAIQTAAPGRSVVLVVYQTGGAAKAHTPRPVAGLFSFLHRDTVMPYFVGFDERVEIYGLSQFLYAASMRWGVERAFRCYDFGRSRIDNPGAFSFKKLCGFEPTILEYQRYVAPGRRPADLAPGSKRWAAARRLWTRLPLGVTRPLGAWASRSIPG